MNPILRWWQRFRFTFTGKFLCDKCKYDYDGACRQPMRPNAKSCPDFQKR